MPVPLACNWNQIFNSGCFLNGTGVSGLAIFFSPMRAAGSDYAKVVKTTVFLKNMNDFATMNGIYATYFKDNPPARSTVEVARLPKDCLFEIECIALV